MNKSLLPIIIVIVSLFTILSFGAGAEDAPNTPSPSSKAPQTTTYTQAQLDQMLAPIALYPDPLVAQILMAATYPREVAEAARWLQNPDNAALHGGRLATALQDIDWDPSVKALIVLPNIVQMMDSNLQWAEQLGDAFIGQQAEVMDAIQRLRKQALAAGTLRSSPSQTVTTEDDTIAIEPTNPDVWYVPIYNPMNTYGTWPYPDYPPDYFTPDHVFGESLVDFDIGVFTVSDLFFIHHFDFRHHRIDIDDRRFRFLNGGRKMIKPGIWAFDPVHRHGVPHHALELRRSARGSGQVAVPASQLPFRGFGIDRAIRTTPQIPPGVVSPARRQVPSAVQVVPTQRFEQGRSFGNVAPRTGPQFEIRHEIRQPSVEIRRSAPLFESHMHDFDARFQSTRGQSSRSEMAVPRGGGSFGGERRGGSYRGGTSGGVRGGPSGGGRSFGGGGGHR